MPVLGSLSYRPQKFQKQSPANVLKIGALKNFAIFTRKHLGWSLFL